MALTLLDLVLIWPLLTGFVFPPAEEPPLEQHDIDTIIVGWQRRSATLSRVVLTSKYDQSLGIDQFSLYRAHWAHEDDRKSDTEGSRLWVHGPRFRYESLRWAMREHGAVNSTLGRTRQMEAYQRRNPAEFLPALYSFFDDPRGEYRTPHRFVRIFDRSTLQDQWEGAKEEYPRVTIHKATSVGARQWALLSKEEEPSHRLDTLNLLAGLLSTSPLNLSFMDFDVEAFTLSNETSWIDGAECLVLHDHPSGDSPAKRTIWIEPDREFAVRRYLGQWEDEGIQIDIRYQEDDMAVSIPSSWTIMHFRGEDPVRAFVNASVTVRKLQDVSKKSLFQIPRIPDKSWVVNELTGEQYIHIGEGEKRLITDQDLIWQPTYEELRKTNPGDVRKLIASKIRWHSFWKTYFPAFILIGVILLAGGWRALNKGNRATNADEHKLGDKHEESPRPELL